MMLRSHLIFQSWKRG